MKTSHRAFFYFIYLFIYFYIYLLFKTKKKERRIFQVRLTRILMIDLFMQC